VKINAKKKFEFNQRVRMRLIIISIAAVGIVLLLLCRALFEPGRKEEKETLYTYNQKANIFYRVFVKPNILYDESTIAAGNVYITQLINYINVFFEYNFQGQADAQIQGDYEVVAVMEGYKNEDQSYQSIWKRQWVIVPKTNFESNGTSVSLQKEVPLDFNQYNHFAQQVIKDTKINSEIKMTVFLNVHLKGNTAQGSIEENMSPSMVIPLNTNYFKIGGTLSEQKPGSIDETKRIKAPLDSMKVILYSVLTSILLSVLVFLIFFTVGKGLSDPLEKEFRKILKKHGNRFVALNSKTTFSNENVNQLKCMDDLVRLADEIGKPILYKHSTNLEDMVKFYVLDNEQVYVLDLKNVQRKEYNATI
jgi:hypothetical protein